MWSSEVQLRIRDIEYRCALARARTPRDIFTKVARLSMAANSILSIPLVPVELVTTFAGGCLIALTFGLFWLVLTAIWLPFLGFLLATSWLWLKAWPLRPALLIPGLLVALLAHVYVILSPEREKDAKIAKLALVEEWPLSWYLMKPPPEYYAGLTGDESGWANPYEHEAGIEFDEEEEASK